MTDGRAAAAWSLAALAILSFLASLLGDGRGPGGLVAFSHWSWALVLVAVGALLYWLAARSGGPSGRGPR